ncbi:MAG: hypothetical protein PVF91_06505 [Chromatiales bacterium]|jgi:hypothetical protein
MEIVLILLGIALVLLWLMYRHRASEEQRYLRDVIGAMDRDSLKREFESCCSVVGRQLIDPRRSGISAAEAAKCLHRAVQCRDRLNLLEGRENGPEFRDRFRTELARSLQGIADTRRNR